MTAGLRAPRSLAPLRHRGFRLLVAGQVTSRERRPAVSRLTRR
jgi:hypothetical protein